MKQYYDESYLDRYADPDEYRNKYRALLAEVARLTTERGRILDIGCSGGLLLDEARKMGFEPYGIDISPEGVRRARDLGLPNIIQENLLHADFPANFFAVITMNHVIEHVDDPFAYLRKVAEWLTPGGFLVIGVPNFSSSSARRDGADWNMLYAHEHISQFTVAALRKAVVKHAGLKVRTVTGVHRHGIPPKTILNKVNYFICYLKDKLLLTRNMLLVAQKPGIPHE